MKHIKDIIKKVSRSKSEESMKAEAKNALESERKESEHYAGYLFM